MLQNFLSSFFVNHKTINIGLLKDSEKEKHPIHKQFKNNKTGIENLINFIDFNQAYNLYGIFFIPNEGGTKAADINNIYYYGIDIDFDVNIETNKKSKVQELLNFELKPNYIIETKRGIQVFWKSENNKQNYATIVSMLIDKFQADKIVKSPNHLFRMPFTTHLKDIKSPFKTKIIYQDLNNKYSEESFLKYCVKKPEINIVETKVNFKNEMTVHEFINYVNSKDIRSLLHINKELGKAFCCIYHKDEKPSANIFLHNGIYFYKCFSSNCKVASEKGLTYFELYKFENKKTSHEALKELSKHFNVHLTNNMTKFRDEYRISKKIIIDNFDNYELKGSLKKIKFYTETFFDYMIQHIEKANYSDNILGADFLSTTEFARLTGTVKSTAYKALNTLCAMGIIQKLKENEIPKSMLAQSKQHQWSNGQPSLITYYYIPKVDLNEINKNINKIIKAKCSITSLNHEIINLVINDVSSNTIKEDRIITKIITEIDNNHYAFKPQLKYMLWKKILAKLCLYHNIIYVKVNHELSEKYDIKYSNKWILLKI
jgi:predicted transcriptional regulator